MKTTFLTALLLLVITLSGFTQNNQILIGRVLDKKTEKPIPFATIFYKENFQGVISNADGSFRFPIDTKLFGNPINISCIGYETGEINPSQLDLSQIHNIYLVEKAYSIDEALIKEKKKARPSARKIVELAITNIKKNYSHSPFLLKGYYRDYLKMEDQYVNLYEANVEIEDLGFKSIDFNTTRLKLNYGQMNQDFPIDSNKIIDYGSEKKIIPHGYTSYTGGNEMAFLRVHDPIRNYKRKSFDFIKKLDTEFTKLHAFKIENLITYNNSRVYKIKFEYLNENEEKRKKLENSSTASIYFKPTTKTLAEGYIYINGENYTIQKLEYIVSLYDRGKKTTETLWELNLEYRDFKDKAYLNYISFNNQIELPQYNDSVYFYLKNILIDRQAGCLKLVFNNEVDPKSGLKAGNYKFDLGNEKLNIEEISVGKYVVRIMIENFDAHFYSFKTEDLNKLHCEIKRVKDLNGNKIYDFESIKAYQYRELFINDIDLEYAPIPEGLYLDKYKSMINHKIDQGKLKGKQFFNSPLLQ